MSRRCGCSDAVCACVVQGDGTTITVTGNGTTTSPYVIAATGSDTVVHVADTATVDMHITGSGTTADPYVISGDGVAGAGGTVVHVSDTGTIDMHVSGSGTSGDPYVISADALPTFESVFTTPSTGSTETIPDPTTATIDHLTLDANCVLTFPAAFAGLSFTLVLTQDATGSRTVTWPGTVQWPGGTAPTLTTTAAKSDVFSFMCVDGTNWLGFVAGQNYS